MPNRKSWDKYYLDIAEQVALRSTCLSRKIGAVLVKDKIIVCEGYNGAARNIPHCGPERLKNDHVLAHRMNDAFNPVFGDNSMCPRRRLGFATSQGLHLCPAVHAEANCIANAARIGICTFGTSIYLTCGTPCKDCLSLIINAGIQEVIVTSLDFYDDLSKFILKMSKGVIEVRTYEKEE